MPQSVVYVGERYLGDPPDAVDGSLWYDVLTQSIKVKQGGVVVTVGGGGGGSVNWDSVLGKPTEFPPEIHNHDAVYPTITAISSALAGKSDTGHNHDSQYYTETEVDNFLAPKAPLASPTFTGTVSGVTKAHVGLPNVDNTSDAAKPVSTAQQTALNGKAASAHKANHVSGGSDTFAATDLIEALVKRLLESGGASLLIGAIADGQYLKRSGTGIIGDTPVGGAGVWTTIKAVADESKNSSAVVADDNTLVVSLLANTQYTLRLTALFLTNTTADLKYRLVFTGTTTRVRRLIRRTATSDVIITPELKTAFDVADVVLCTTGLNPWLEETVLLQVGAAGGNLKLQWAQVVSNAGPTTRLDGSYLEYMIT